MGHSEKFTHWSSASSSQGRHLFDIIIDYYLFVKLENLKYVKKKKLKVSIKLFAYKANNSFRLFIGVCNM